MKMEIVWDEKLHWQNTEHCAYLKYWNMKPSEHPRFEMNLKWQHNTTQPPAAVDFVFACYATPNPACRSNPTGQ